MQTPPARLHLDGRRLRLWVAAAGRPDEGGYLLGLDPGARTRGRWWAPRSPPPACPPPPTAPAAPAYRISGRRRLARLAELTGEAPPAVPAGTGPELRLSIPAGLECPIGDR